jgi:hypothetical protein
MLLENYTIEIFKSQCQPVNKLGTPINKLGTPINKLGTPIKL